MRSKWHRQSTISELLIALMHKKILSSLLIALLSQHLFSVATFSIQEPDGKTLGFERRVDFEIGRAHV